MTHNAQAAYLGQPTGTKPPFCNISGAASMLRDANIDPSLWTQVTGLGHRHGYDSLPEDTIINKLASGALSIYGVCGVLFGYDSPQHKRGHNRGGYKRGDKVICNGNAEAVVCEDQTGDMVTVRLWQGLRHVGDVVTSAADLERRIDLVECIYCGRDASHDSETIPSVDDDQAWAEYAKDHAEDCEWILTRAHRLTGQVA